MNFALFAIFSDSLRGILYYQLALKKHGRALEITAWACPGAAKALEVVVRACPEPPKPAKKLLGSSLVLPEYSGWSLGPAPVPPWRSKKPIGHRFELHRLEDCG